MTAVRGARIPPDRASGGLAADSAVAPGRPWPRLAPRCGGETRPGAVTVDHPRRVMTCRRRAAGSAVTLLARQFQHLRPAPAHDLQPHCAASLARAHDAPQVGHATHVRTLGPHDDVTRAQARAVRRRVVRHAHREDAVLDVEELAELRSDLRELGARDAAVPVQRDRTARRVELDVAGHLLPRAERLYPGG